MRRRAVPLLDLLPPRGSRRHLPSPTRRAGGAQPRAPDPGPWTPTATAPSSSTSSPPPSRSYSSGPVAAPSRRPGAARRGIPRLQPRRQRPHLQAFRLQVIFWLQRDVGHSRSRSRAGGEFWDTFVDQQLQLLSGEVLSVTHQYSALWSPIDNKRNELRTKFSMIWSLACEWPVEAPFRQSLATSEVAHQAEDFDILCS